MKMPITVKIAIKYYCNPTGSIYKSVSVTQIGDIWLL